MKSSAFLYIATLFLLFCSSSLAPGAEDGSHASFLESLYRLDRLPLLRPGTVTNLVSSYDRTGGNEDGYSGKYSKLRLENGNSVIAEMKGPGCIQRFWFTHSEMDRPGLLAGKKEHLRIYLDGKPEPALDYPLEDLFAGKHESFPKPFVGEGLGGFFSYIPVPFEKECKVVVDGDHVRYYQVTWRAFPEDRKIESFTSRCDEGRKNLLKKAAEVWNRCGDPSTLELGETRNISVPLSLEPGKSQSIELPAGPHLVRSIRFIPKEGASDKTLESFLTFHWDGAEKPAVETTLEYFFLAASKAGPLRSLTAGHDGKTYYNFMPMPYKNRATLTLHAVPFPGGLSGTMEVVTEKMPEGYGPFGYFHADFRTVSPAPPGKYLELLKRKGQGHLAGLYMDTDGYNPDKLPVWMEGDDRWFIDGVFRGQGTGTEDYFNAGWYGVEGRLMGPGAFPLHGFPVYRHDERDGKTYCSAYRWHVPDPVSYDTEILAEMEHGKVNDYPADYRVMTFFYDVEP